MANIKGTKLNMLTFEQKKSIVLEHYNKGATFRELSKKYSVSYSAVRKWCLDYEILGDKAIISQTGKTEGQRIHKHCERSTSLDPKDREIALLRKKLKQAEMEAEIRKKFDEAMEKLQNQQSTKR